MSSYPPDIDRYVRQQLDEGVYASEQELVFHAIRIHREMGEQQSQLRDDIQHAIAQADRDEGKPLDLDQVLSEARDRYRQSRD